MQFLPDASVRGLVSVTAAEPHKVYVSRAFIRELSAELRSSQVTLRSSCLPDANPRHAAQLEPLIAEIVLDLSASFVVLHELFHVLNGHTADLMAASKRRRRRLSLEEAAHLVALRLDVMAVSPTAGSPAAKDEMLHAYYLEVEADNSALQWLMQAVPISSPLRALIDLVSADDIGALEIAQLPDGWGRVLAFRALLTALTVTVRLLERQRGDATRAPTPGHPYPMARLFAGAFTIMQQFAEITDMEVDADGAQRRRLSRLEAKDMRTFFEMIVRPLVSAPWAQRDPAAAADGFEIHGPRISAELANLLLGRGPQTEPACELLRIQRLRDLMNRRLARHRCFAPGS